jgi:membrane protein
MAVRAWRNVAVRVKQQMKVDDVPLLAAGVAFFALLALVPALVALVSVYGLVADPGGIERQIEDLLAAAPQEVRDLVTSQLSSIVAGSSSGLGVGVIVGLVVALWSASAGMQHLIGAVNLAYDQEETRGFVKLRGLALVLTVAALVALAAVVAGFIVVPELLEDEGAQAVGKAAILVVRWPLLAVLGLLGLAVLYRYAPDRDQGRGRWRWVTPGAVFAVVVWVIASVGFSIYTANFGRYNETYGALGAIVVVMLWLYITAYVVIVGAEINAELERQRARAGAVGAPREGRRRAYAPRTAGEAPAPG